MNIRSETQGREPFDVCGFCMAYEAGELGGEAIAAGFQRLIDSGLAWQLQGHYGRMARTLIEAGHCTARGAS
jgi:hypothetical protein